MRIHGPFTGLVFIVNISKLVVSEFYIVIRNMELNKIKYITGTRSTLLIYLLKLLGHILSSKDPVIRLNRSRIAIL